MQATHRSTPARLPLPTLPRHRPWPEAVPVRRAFRLPRSEMLVGLAALALATLFVMVMLQSVAQAERRQASADVTQQRRSACEQLPGHVARRACADAATAAGMARSPSSL